MLQRVLQLLVFFAAALLCYRAFHWYPLLPDPFPIHFNVSGEADGWAAKGPAWFLIPGLAILLGALLLLLARALKRPSSGMQAFVNLPQKDRWLRLPQEERTQVLQPTTTFLHWAVLLLLLLFLYIVEGTGRMATHQWTELPVWPVFMFLAGVIGGVPILLRATNKALSEASSSEVAAP